MIPKYAINNAKSIEKLSNQKYDKKLFILIIPFILQIIIFGYLPLIGWVISFFDYKPGVNLFECKFVGLYWVKLLAGDSQGLANALLNTFAMSGLAILASPLPAVFAILLSELQNNKFKWYIQTITTLPNFVSWVIVYSLFFLFFSTDGGYINDLLSKLNIVQEPIPLLQKEDWTWYVQTAAHIWKNLGFSAIIYIAAIAGIDSELYDAANVDGAGRFGRIWHIVVPGIIPTFFVLLLLSISNFLNGGIEPVMAFKNPLVNNRIENLDLYVYNLGIGMGSLSLATLVGMFKSLVSISLLLFANFTAKLFRGEGII